MDPIEITIRDGQVKIRQKTYNGTLPGSDKSYDNLGDVFDYITERVEREVQRQVKSLEKSRKAWNGLLDGLDKQKAI